eukprot:jgi/Psemu1/309718/fgenesh1_kg.548_\
MLCVKTTATSTLFWEKSCAVICGALLRSTAVASTVCNRAVSIKKWFRAHCSRNVYDRRNLRLQNADNMSANSV